jgi:hypothetical protein
MESDLLQGLFEWFVTAIWDKYGPLAGVLSVLAGLSLLFGGVYLAFTLL